MVQLNEELWPVVKLTWQGALTERDVESYLSACEHLLGRGQPHLIIVEMGQAQATAAFPLKKMFSRQRQWHLQNEPLLKGVCLGVVFVFETLRQRAAVSAYLRLQPPQVPTTVVPSIAEALTWTQPQLCQALKPTTVIP